MEENKIIFINQKLSGQEPAIPKFLYKYRPFDGYTYDMLDNAYLYLCPAKNLDDPSECTVSFDMQDYFDFGTNRLKFRFVELILEIIRPYTSEENFNNMKSVIARMITPDGYVKRNWLLDASFELQKYAPSEDCIALVNWLGNIPEMLKLCTPSWVSQKESPENELFLYKMMDVSDLYYIFLLLGAGVFGCLMFRRKPDPVYACMLLFCGTIALHLFVENQNRYHYHLLPLLCLLFGVGVSSLVHMVDQNVMSRVRARERREAEKKAFKDKVALEQREAEECARLRAEALHAQFDMGKALQNGNVRVIMSKRAADSAMQPDPAAAPAGDSGEKPEAASEAKRSK